MSESTDQQGTHDHGEAPDFDDDGHSEEGTILDDGGVDTDDRAGRSQGIDTETEPDDDTKQEMEEERERRLDPENRPDNAEVDNTPRDFDVDRGMFTDRDDYDESGEAPYADPEDPESSAERSDDADDSGDSDTDDAGGATTDADDSVGPDGEPTGRDDAADVKGSADTGTGG